MRWEKFVLVRCEILRLFVNTLNAEYTYSRRKMQNFPQQIQTQLFQKRKAFSRFFIAFLKCTSSLEHCEKKMSLLASVLPKLLAPKQVDIQMTKRPYIRTRFCKQRVSGYETLLESERHHNY